MFYQISRHSLSQSSKHIKLTISKTKEYSPSCQKFWQQTALKLPVLFRKCLSWRIPKAMAPFRDKYIQWLTNMRIKRCSPFSYSCRWFRRAIPGSEPPWSQLRPSLRIHHSPNSLCTILLFSLHLHTCWSQWYSLINFLHANLCLAGNPNYNTFDVTDEEISFSGILPA